MSAYKQGQEDFKAGKDFWQNPYGVPTSRKDDFYAWFAGWCHAKQESQ